LDIQVTASYLQKTHTRGQCGRGGFEVDIEWKDRKIVCEMIRNLTNSVGGCVMCYGSITRKIVLALGDLGEAYSAGQ